MTVRGGPGRPRIALARGAPLLFVYGSLMSSGTSPMARLLAGAATLIGEGSIAGRLYDLGAYPAAVGADDSADRVHGEVYLLRNAPLLLARLDRYELCDADSPRPHAYARTRVEVLLRDGRSVDAIAYLYQLPVPAGRRIATGRWRPRT